MKEVLESPDSDSLDEVEEKLSTDRRGFMTGRWGQGYDQAKFTPQEAFFAGIMSFSVFAATAAFSDVSSKGDEDNIYITFENYEGFRIDEASLTDGSYNEEETNFWGRVEFDIPSEAEYSIEVIDNSKDYNGEVYLEPGEDITVDLKSL